MNTIMNVSSSWLEIIINSIKTICEIINLNISSIESYVNIFCQLLTTILLVLGVIVIKKMKDKKVDATTDFYSKLKVHLIHLKNQLGTEEFTVLNYLYDESILKSGTVQKPKSCETFLNVVNSFLLFLKNSDNQTVPSHNFFCNLNILIEKLSELSLMPEYHPFSDLHAQEVKKELKDLKDIIDKLINEIDIEQKELFKSIWKDKTP